MIWARLICLGIVVAVAAFVRWASGYFAQQDLAILFSVVPLPFAAAALLTLALSFFRTEKQDGRLLISRENTFMRVVSKFMDPGQKVTVCSLFWTTVMLLIMGTMVLGMLGLLAYGAYKTIIGDLPPSKPITTKDAVIAVGATISIVVAFIGVVAKEKATTSNRRRFGWAIIIASVVMLLANALFLGPLWGVADEGHLSLTAALPGYLELFRKWALPILTAVGIIAAFLAAVVGIIFGLFAGIKALRTSLIGQIFAKGWQAFKSRTCPIVSVIEEEQKPTEAPSP